MRLFESPDFEQAITQAQRHYAALGLSEQIIEKDYYVTEALRLLAQNYGDKIIFKGGTSLSKGWNLIQRFSEDIDIFLDPQGYTPPLSKRGIDRELKSVRDAVAAFPGLTYDASAGKTIGGFGRSDYFAYSPRFSGIAAIAPRVIVEAGTASGTEPTATVELHSYLGRFLNETSVTLGAEDEQPFPMRLLHFRRTFVEKLFAIHSKIEMYKEKGLPLGSYARHYYDLYQLSGQAEVLNMLASLEYEEIKTDYERVSLTSFPGSYRAPRAMRFSNSDAIYPKDFLREMIAAEYQQQCEVLCFGPFPTWQEVETRFDELKSAL